METSSPVTVLHFECFQEAYFSALEENRLIRIGGDEDSYAGFILSEKVEKSELALNLPHLWDFQFAISPLDSCGFSTGQ